MIPLPLKAFRTILSFGLIVLLSLLSGCSSYQLGSPGQITFESIYIKPIANRSFAPQAQSIISAQLRETFIHDARIRVVAREKNADVVLDITLIDYDQRAAARSSVDTVVADNFDLYLTANVSLLNQSTGEALFENRSVETKTNIYTNNPYIENQPIAYQLSERQAMEQLARQIARKIADEVLSPW